MGLFSRFHWWKQPQKLSFIILSYYNHVKILVIILILLCIVGAIFLERWYPNYGDWCLIRQWGSEWYLEIADSERERSQWLMHRETLCQKCGMIFIFPDKKPLSFWMKNTLIPLDIYFYDTDGQLIDIVKNMRPEHETSEPMRYTSLAARYAIEVNQWSDFDDGRLDLSSCMSSVNNFQ